MILRVFSFGSVDVFFCGMAIPSFWRDFYTAVILIRPTGPIAYAADDAVSDYHVALWCRRIFAPAVSLNFVIFFYRLLQVP